MKTRTFNKQYNHLKKVGDMCFEEVFRSIQLLHYTVLYYDFDFTKDDIKQFNANITTYNNECIDDKETFFAEEQRLVEQFGFSCEQSAKNFPTRAKMRMNKKVCSNRVPWSVALSNSTDAIEVCLVLFLHELTTTWSKDAADIALYWEKLCENAMNYANGMTDDFVRQYFRNEIDLDIKG